MNEKNGLSPTLWRTCRVLAGPTRLGLLREIIQKPDRTVKELGEALAISETRTSQELRRLQSRGLIQRTRKGRWVTYRAVSDPLVASARPLLMAMKAVLAEAGATADTETLRIAAAFANSRRQDLVKALLGGPVSSKELRRQLGLSPVTLSRHLRQLREAGVIQRRGRQWETAAFRHPLIHAVIGQMT